MKSLLLCVVILLAALLVTAWWPRPAPPWRYQTFSFDVADRFNEHRLSFGDISLDPAAPPRPGSGPFEFYGVDSLLEILGRDRWEVAWTDGRHWLVRRPAGSGQHDFFLLDAPTNAAAETKP